MAGKRQGSTRRPGAKTPGYYRKRQRVFEERRARLGRLVGEAKRMHDHPSHPFG